MAKFSSGGGNRGAPKGRGGPSSLEGMPSRGTTRERTLHPRSAESDARRARIEREKRKRKANRGKNLARKVENIDTGLKKTPPELVDPNKAAEVLGVLAGQPVSQERGPEQSVILGSVFSEQAEQSSVPVAGQAQLEAEGQKPVAYPPSNTAEENQAFDKNALGKTAAPGVTPASNNPRTSEAGTGTSAEQPKVIPQNEQQQAAPGTQNATSSEQQEQSATGQARPEASQGAPKEAAGSSQQQEGGAGSEPPQNPPENASKPGEQNQGITPPRAEQPQQTEKEKLEQAADATLAANAEYQAARQSLERAENERWRAIDGAADKDDQIDNLSREDRKAYTQYVREREAVYMMRQEAIFAKRQEQIDAKVAAKGSTTEEIRQERIQLAKDRANARSKSELEQDETYQGNKRAAKRIEEQIRNIRDKDGNRIYSDNWVDDLANNKTNWKDIENHTNFLVGEGMVFKDKKAFQEYQKARDERNNRENAAAKKKAIESIDASMSQDEIQTMLERTIASKRRTQSKFRRGFRRAGQWLDNYFGAGALKEHKTAAAGYAELLREVGGMRSFLSVRLIPKKPNETEEAYQQRCNTARNIKKLMMKEVGAYARRRALRTLWLYILISAAAYMLTPVLMAKAVEVSKVFTKS